MCEARDEGKSNNLIQRFNYADSRVPFSMEKDGTLYYLFYDQVGSLRVVSDSSGNVVKEVDYDSFGNILSDSDENLTIPFGFAGGLHDRDINLVRFGFRDYDPYIGKWTARDPILFEGGDSNLYWYVLNDPMNLVDRDGLWIRPIIGIAQGIARIAYISKYIKGYKQSQKIAKEIKHNGGQKAKGCKGGGTFKNKKNELPNGGSYKEYDIYPYQKGVNRGPDRIVKETKSNTYYYTPNHYKTFVEIK